MQACPFPGCTSALGATVGTYGLAALAQHLVLAHRPDGPAGPVRPGAKASRSWRCPICRGGKRTYATSTNLAAHLQQMHGEAVAPVQSPSPAARPQAQPSPTGEAGALRVPCMPWLPRPWLSPPPATVLLCTWNVERFTLSSAQQGGAARKLVNMCVTLRELCRAEGPRASVIVALQEVMSRDAVALLAEHLTASEARPGGSGRAWHSATSSELGNNAERSAFLWSGPPAGAAPPARPRCLPCCGGPAGGAAAPLHADPATSFHLLGEEDLRAVLRSSKQGACEGRFLRSPYYALFRVGYANLLLVNVHLAAGEAKSELAALHSLAAAIERPNARLFRRHSLSGRLRGRAPRGLTAVLGDFNCPAGPAVALARPAPAGAAAPPAPTPTATAPVTAPRARAPAGPVAEAMMRPDAGAAAVPAVPAAAGAAGGWPAFERHGWLNVLAQPPTATAAGAPPPPLTATNWRAQRPLALDAICLPRPHAGLVTGRGVCAPPPYVDAAQPAVYPNHLLCWVRLELGPLQRAPGKVRALQEPLLRAPAAAR